MQSDVRLHRATEEDGESIHRVAERAWRETYDGVIPDETIGRILESGHAAGCIEDAIARRETSLFVARTDGTVVGYASAESTAMPGVGTLGIYLDPDYWGDGIGSRLLDRTLADLRDRGRARIRDYVLADNDVGNAFYDKHFEHVGQNPVEIGDEQHRANVYEMEL